MKKINLILVFLLLTIWSYGQLTVTISSIPAMAGQTVNIPVKLTGTGTPISSINLSIVFDTAQLEYITTTNFTPQAPAPEWAFSAKYNENCNGFAANASWAHPSGQSTSFTEGTTLYELQFLYKGGNGPLTFCVYQIKDANNDPIAVTAVNGSVHPLVLSGPSTVCEGSAGNVYSTDAGQTNYQWSLTGGTITSGGGTTDHTATVTWNSAGSQNISVTCNGTVTATLPVLVNTSAAQAGVSIVASANSVCAGTSVTFTATPVNGGTNPAYQWKKNGTDVGANNPEYTYVPANNDVITCIMTSDLGCVTGNPATSNAITMSVTAKVTASVSISASQNPVSPGTTVTMTANPVNGGALPSFEWKLNGLTVGSNASAYSFVPVSGDQIFCLMTTSLTCVNNAIATSNVVTLTVTNPNALIVTLPEKIATPGDILYFPVKLKGASSAGVPISGANIQISYDTTILAYDTILNFYGPMPSSQWFFSGNNSIVSANWIESNLQTVAVPDSTTLFEIKFTYLGGMQTLPFVVYEFTNANFDLIPTTPYHGAVGTECPVSVTIAASENPVCAGSPVTFTATPVNGGANPFYQWKKNGSDVGANSPEYSYVPANNDVIICQVTSDLFCATGNPATSNAITMSVTAKVTASVSISASQNPVSPGTTVTLTANPVNGGAMPSFEWKLNGVTVGTNASTYSFIPVNGDQVFCLMSTSLTCVNNPIATSNVVTLSVTNPNALIVTLPSKIAAPGDILYFPVKLKGASSAGVPISGANIQISYDTTILAYDTIVNFYGPMPSSQWFFSGNNSIVSANWIESNLQTLAIPDSTTLFEIKFTYLGGSQILPFVVYEFTNANFDLIPTTPYNGSVSPTCPVSVTIAASENPVCAGASVTFTATPVNGASNPVYQWKKNSVNVGTNSPVYTVVPANNDVIICELTSDTICATGSPATSNAITISVTAKVTASVSIAASQNPVTSGTTVTMTANPVNGGASPTFEWKLNGLTVGSNASAYSFVPVSGDQVFCLMTTSLTCVNNAIATSNVVTLSVSNPNALTVTLPDQNAMPGDVLHFPVKLVGAGTNGVPISGVNVQIAYDTTVLAYDTLVNFYSQMPTTQWIYSGNNSLVSANWIEPSLSTLPVPDNTTLFEIRFTYLGGNSSLPFVTYEFTDATFEMIPTTHVDGSVSQLVPNQELVQNVTVGNGTDTCFNALQTITVAGSGTTFTVQNGGSAELIAGQKITMLPGTIVQPGGYLHARITLTNSFCNQQPSPVVASAVSQQEITSAPQMAPVRSGVKLYPNPTEGSFTVSLTGDEQILITAVSIYSATGLKVSTVRTEGLRKIESSLSGFAPGIYFVHVTTLTGSEILKIVKL